MSDPYVGEIRLFAGNFAPLGWMLCAGQLLPISENETLFNLIGTTYGGDGQQTFALPDLRGRVPMHQGTFIGTPYQMGEVSGTETVTLQHQHLPAHTHSLIASTAAASGATPAGAVLAATSVASYDSGAATTAMAGTAIGTTGGAQPHDNMAPTLAINYIIAMSGIYPSPT